MKHVLEIILTHKLSEVPEYHSNGAAAFDLQAALDEPMYIYPGESRLVPTGIKVWVKDPQYAGVIIPRSGRGHKEGLVLGNGIGLIDSDYQGELMVSACNRNHVGPPLIIEPWTRIAQFMVIRVEQVNLMVVRKFSDASRRGENGFGHTGV